MLVFVFNAPQWPLHGKRCRGSSSYHRVVAHKEQSGTESPGEFVNHYHWVSTPEQVQLVWMKCENMHS